MNQFTFFSPFLLCMFSSDKEAPDANEVEPSVLGLQSYWDDTYVEDLANFHQHGHAGEVWLVIVGFSY